MQSRLKGDIAIPGVQDKASTGPWSRSRVEKSSALKESQALVWWNTEGRGSTEEVGGKDESVYRCRRCNIFMDREETDLTRKGNRVR